MADGQLAVAAHKLQGIDPMDSHDPLESARQEIESAVGDQPASATPAEPTPAPSAAPETPPSVPPPPKEGPKAGEGA